MNKKKSGIIIFIIIIALAVLCAIFSTISVIKLLNNSNQNVNSNGSTIVKKITTSSFEKSNIAAIYIEGIIQDQNQSYNQKWLLETVNKLKESKTNKAIALFINSPGGNVYQADELYLALQNYKTSGKPIYVYQGPLSASGGYYISCAGTKIYANRNSLIGSIGVISSQSVDITQLMNKIGITATTITAGKNKNMMNFNEPVTQEQKEIMQEIANECYEQFTGIVAINRNIPLFEVKKLADGRIYTANQALKNKLIDGIDSWENMLKLMKETEFNGENLSVVEYKYKDNTNLVKYLMNALSKENPLKIVNNSINKAMLTYPAYIYEN